MLGGGIPGGLSALLVKLGLVQPGAEAEAHAMAGQPKKAGKEAALDKPGLEKGALLGEDGELAAGLGFAGKDRQTARKNLVETANVNRFLSEVQDSGPQKLGAREAAPENAETQANETEDAPQNLREERGAEIRRDEGREEARQLAQKEAVEERETRLDKEAEAEARERDKQDEEDRPGGGWVAEELEGEEEEDQQRGLRDPDSLGEVHRCRFELEGGGGCLRKPVKGTPYCRAHSLGELPPQNRRA